MQTRPRSLHVSVRDQLLTLKEDDVAIRSYPISTSQFGLGSEEGSMKTPVGQFRIGEKIGDNAVTGTIFKNREPISEGKDIGPNDDLIMSRILWLDGLDDHNANTRDRFIYIHGTNHETTIGEPASHGCIRMKNADVIELFDLVDEETPVIIEG
jgi:L,D-transpeptidase YbiS